VFRNSGENMESIATEHEGTKYGAAADKLTTLARQLGPGARLPTFVQLRQELQVSVTTLMSALSDLEARGILQRRHGVGIYVARDVDRRNIALLFDPGFLQGESGASPFWHHFLQQTWRLSKERGESFSVHFVENALPAARPRRRPQKLSAYTPIGMGDILAADLRHGRIHGVLGAGQPACIGEWLRECGVPYVAFAGYARHSVVLDMPLGIQLGVEALAARGCRRIGFWTNTCPNDDTQTHEVYRRTLTALGYRYDPALVFGGGSTPPGLSEMARGEWIARTVFGPHSEGPPVPRPDGILCGVDTLARGALPTLLQMGIRPGTDIPFATHTNANSPLLFGFEDNLIRLEMDPVRLVSEMYTLLDALLENRASDEEMVKLTPTVRS
jgi:hypothetical protein